MKVSVICSGWIIFGVVVYMGVLMVCFGIDSVCDKGEFFVINDFDEYYRKLVWYYSRLGWKFVYEVIGDLVWDFVYMLVWGGVGICMDVDF